MDDLEYQMILIETIGMISLERKKKLQDNLEPITNNKEDEKKAVQHLNLKDPLVKQLIKKRFNK